MTARIILQVFEQYQKARMQFVQTVTDLASRPHNVEYLDNAGVLDLLCPLLWDVMPSIQQLTAIALGRLANHDEKIARAILKRNILPQLLKKIDKQTVRLFARFLSLFPPIHGAVPNEFLFKVAKRVIVYKDTAGLIFYKQNSVCPFTYTLRALYSKCLEQKVRF